MNIVDQIRTSFLNHITSFAPDLDQSKVNINLNVDPDKQSFGDLTSNAALVIASEQGQTPRLIAEKIIQSFSHLYVLKIEIAGPGFINIFFTLKALQTLADELFTQGDTFLKTPLNKKQKINIEFVSANPTGPLHIGHGRGGIIGDVLARIVSFQGTCITKEHYINDAGAQMVKLGHSFKIRCEQLLGKKTSLSEDAYSGKYLTDLAQQCIKENGKHILNESDDFFITYSKDHLLAQLKQTLKQYNITFDVWFSEQQLHPKAIQNALTKLTQAGATYEKEGALWFRASTYEDDKDRVLKKADGTYTYAAGDAAYLLNKAQRGFTHAIMVLGQDHHNYPKRLEGIRQALNINMTLSCILYQLVSMKKSGEQVRMSKRTGNIITLQNLINAVGTDVARFFYLHRKADAHLEFDVTLALKHTEENPVYYLQYAYVRTKSVLEKADEHPALRDITQDDAKHIGKQETLLIKKCASLKDLLAIIARSHQVHLLTYFCLEFAHIFHHYYHHNRIIDPTQKEQSRSRLAMIIIVRCIFSQCLDLMGISKPKKM